MGTPNPNTAFVPLGMNTEVGMSEWNEFLRRRAQLIDAGVQRLGLASQFSLQTGIPLQNSFQATSFLGQMVGQEQTGVSQNEPLTEAEYTRLLGAADFYGIQNAEVIDPNQLRAMIQERREIVVREEGTQTESVGEAIYDAVATALGTTGVNMVDAVAGGLRRVPFLGDALAKTEAYQNFRRGLATLEEGFTADMLDNERAAYERVATPLQHFLGYSALVGVAAEGVAATGFAGGIANPFIRGTLQGGATGWVLEGGGDESIADRAMRISLFAGLQGVAEWGLPKLMARLRRSFPRSADDVLEAQYRPGYDPGVIDAEFVVVDEVGNVIPQMRQLPSGSRALPSATPAQELPGSQRALPPTPVLEGELFPVPQLPSGPRLIPSQSSFIGDAEWAIVPETPLLPRRTIGPGQYDMPPANPPGLPPSGMAPGVFQVGPGTTSFPRAGNTPALNVAQAAGDAIALTKRGMVMESPALPGFSNQPVIQDADVAVAALASNPGQISVIQGVGDTAATIRRFLQEFLPNGVGPQDFRAVRRGDRVDLLVADGRAISNKMVKEYESFGMFRGQQATTPSGLQVVIEEVGPEFSTVRRLGASAAEIVSTAELMPGRSSMIADAVPQAYLEFKTFAQSRMAQEAAASGLNPMKMADWFSDEMASQLPRYLGEFLDLQGVQGQGARGVYTSSFTEARVADFKTLAPQEFAAADELAAEVVQAHTMAVVRGSRPISLQEVAESKGMSWVPAPQAQGGTMVDLVTGEEIAMESTEAGFQFLRGFNRTPPDYTPLTTTPAELAAGPVGAAQPGSSLGPRHYMSEVDLSESAGRHLDEMEMMLGGGGMPPLGPPAGGVTGSFGSPQGPQFLPPADETLGAQFERLRTERPRTYDEVMGRFDSLSLRAFEPMRNFALLVEDSLQGVGITRGTYWQHYSNIVQGRAVAHNEAVPWHREINDALSLIRRRFIRDGTVTLIGEMPEPIARSAMANAGYTEREIAGQMQLRQILERLRLEYSEPGNEIARIMDYMPHLRARAARAEPLGDLDELFGNGGRFFAQQVREGGIDVREMNAAVLLHRWVRAATVNRHVTQPVNEMATAWVHDPRVPIEFRRVTSDWLDLITVGHTPGQDILIPGIRHALNALKIPVTNGEVARGLNWMFTNMYRGALGGRPDVIVRDLIGPLFGSTRTGFGATAKAYTQFFRGGTGRQEMIDLAMRGGWVERGMVPMGAAEMFQGGYGALPGVAASETNFSPIQNLVRAGFARGGDLIRDAMPRALRGGIQGTRADPLFWYTKGSEFNRLISGHSGYLAMRDAIKTFDSRRVQYIEDPRSRTPAEDLKSLIGDLLRESGAANYPGPIQRRIAELVTSRQYEEAMFTFANEVANSQFRYGTAEQSLAVRSAGVVGRFGSTFGTFTQQYIAQMKEGMTTGLLPEFGGTSVDRVRSATAFLARHSMIASALGLATAYTGWNFGKWIWHGSLGWGGGPMLMAFITKVQEMTGKFNEAQGEVLSPMQQWAVQQSRVEYESPLGFPNNLNPYGGFMRTLEGLGQTMSSANPTEGTLEFLMTGKRNSGDMVREFNNAPFQLNQPPAWAPPPPWAQGQVPQQQTLWVGGTGAAQ